MLFGLYIFGSVIFSGLVLNEEEIRRRRNHNTVKQLCFKKRTNSSIKKPIISVHLTSSTP